MIQRGTIGAVLALLAGVGLARGQSRVRRVTISALGNEVQQKLPPPPGTRDTGTAWAQASRDAPVIEGEQLRTSILSFAEVELECGSALRLAQESQMAFDRLRLSSNGLPETTVTLNRGAAFFTLQDADSGAFIVNVPGGAISMPKGGAKLRLDVPADKPDSVEVLDGQIRVQSGGRTATVHARRRFEFLPAGGINLVALLKPDAWQKWSHRRDSDFHRRVMMRTRLRPMPNLTSLMPAQVRAAPDTTVEPQVVLGLPVAVMHQQAHRAKKPPTVPACAHR